MDDTSGQALHSLLTTREIEIFRMVLLGLSNRDIADELVLAPDTVRWYTKQIYGKLGVHGRIEAITRARDMGWLDTPAQPAPTRNNLPSQLTPLIGRERELADAKRLLQRSRLVTLTGPGGIGKTRLAAQLAEEVADDFTDGVCFVPLAPISDPTLVANAIMQALDVSEAAGEPLAKTLANFLHRKQMLLVLDNFEHIIQAAPLVAELLAAAPRLRVVVTSREALHLYGEYEYAVPPLAVPDLQQPQLAETLTENEAAALFVQRAEAVRSDFQIDDANAQAVAEICVRLDGLPLALELAAARVKLFTPQMLLERLATHASLLTTLADGSRNVDARQQTLRGTIDWSYDLLSEPEQALLQRLSIFAGGWTLDAAEAVCADEIGSSDVVGLLTQLVNKSLVMVAEVGGRMRYHLLETIRQYASEKLAQSDERAAIADRHLNYFLVLAEQAESAVDDPTRIQRYDRLEEENDNLRAALAWAIESERVESGLRLTGALGHFWWSGANWREGHSWLERLLATGGDASLPVRAKALSRLAHLTSHLGDNEQARTIAEESLRLARQSGDKPSIASALDNLAFVLTYLDDYMMAVGSYEESLALFREIEYTQEVAGILGMLGRVLTITGDYERAVELSDEAITLGRKLGQIEIAAWSLYTLGNIRCYQGDTPLSTEANYQEMLLAFQDHRRKFGTSRALWGLGIVAQIRKDYERSRLLFSESLALNQEIGNRGGILTSSALLAGTARLQGDYEQAQLLCHESLRLLQTKDTWIDFQEVLVEAGKLADSENRPFRAAQLFGASEKYFHIFGCMTPTNRADFETSLASVRGQLGESAFREAYAQGEAMSAEQALAYAGRETADG